VVCCENPHLESRLLLAHVLDCAQERFFSHPEQRLERGQIDHFNSLVERRCNGEPLPYLTGQAEFFGHTFLVDERVLIPRPETELLVERALRDLAPNLGRRTTVDGLQSVVDVGTGSGCIAVVLAMQACAAHVFAVDISKDALNVAKKNARRHGVAANITFLHSDLLQAVPKPVDLIIANPPYISQKEWHHLPREVKFYEPRAALYGGADGLQIVAELLEQARSWLRSGGSLLMEIGSRQGHSARSLACSAFPDAHVAVLADLAGRDRVLHVQTA
jgi:release factor glutamine methyltransferase